MNAQELALQIQKKLNEKHIVDEDEWLRILNELRNFVKNATDEEIDILHRKCSKADGEMFSMVAMGIEYRRQMKK